jgi:CDP-4-dehydro-6-deoxyglucose reductase, E1
VNDRTQHIRERIIELVGEYYEAEFSNCGFDPGVSAVPVSGRVFDAAEMQSLVDSALDFWLTTGRFAAAFERKLAKFIGVRCASLVNSGSSANLVALSALTSPKLGDRALRPGDEVITVAAGFPTTVNPIIQNGLVPVFVDITLPTFNIDVTQLNAALSERTRAIVIAHTLGNPFNLGAVTEFARKHNLWLIEDCCDALGSHYNGQHVGTFGDLATLSFYPAHHITMGEGGCVFTNSPMLKTLVESFRDWGRDCWCDPGAQDTCGKRFDWQLGDLPPGYDHKYTYSHIGYNLKVTDMQAAVGLAQLAKLPKFVEIRRKNFNYLHERLKPLEDIFLLPEKTPRSEPSWFGYLISLRANSPFSREDLLRHLDTRRVGFRLLFAGNLLRQPAYRHIRHRVIGELPASDFAMRNAFWIGVYPGLSEEMLDHAITSIFDFCARSVCAAEPA